MAKNIILCSDGTGNTAIKGRGTNVFKLYEAVELNGNTKQKVFYDDGVGTQQFKLFKIFGGAFGFGLSRNVRDLYTSLARVYEPGDNIYLFGFSRGAHTVRTLSGFIHHCGILDAKKHCHNDADLKKKVAGAYKAYRHRYSTIFTKIWRAFFTWNTRNKYGFNTIEEFRKYTFEFKDNITPIHFIGVWDTVCAVGFPIMGVAKVFNKIYQVSFPDNKLCPNVAHAFQALSVDDKRKTFHPEMWNESDKELHNQEIEQVWFAGVHSNVGGGYPKQGMSLVTLDWMMDKAESNGLKFIRSVRDEVQAHKNVNDKMYDSRAGVAVYYRYAPRDIDMLSRNNSIKTTLIHDSVLKRTIDGTEGYAPGNLPKGCKFVATGQEGYVNEYEAALFSKEMGNHRSLLEVASIKKLIMMRKMLQPFFYLLTGLFVFLFIKHYSLADLIGLANEPAAMTSMKMLVTVLMHSIWFLIPVVIVVMLSLMARGRIQNCFSGFWYALVKKLPSSGARIQSDVLANVNNRVTETLRE